MGDKVEEINLRMTDDLDELKESGLFSDAELKDISKCCIKFEFKLLRKHCPLKIDYLSYLDYQKLLLNLIRKRAYLFANNDGNNNKKLEIAGLKRVLNIYHRATNKFKGDLHLWFQFLDFCREQLSTTTLKKDDENIKYILKRHLTGDGNRFIIQVTKVQAKVIRLHPKVPGVWIYAAAWEFDHSLDARAARNLMQTGLRNCPYSEELWVEYLRMELTYLNKLKARKVAQGTLVCNKRKADEKQWRDENKDSFMSLDEKIDNNDVAEVSEGGETKTGEDLFCEQGSSIIRTVYGGAVKALACSFSLRTRFIKVLEATDVDHSDDLRREILADMERDFSKEPEYWDWLARTEITHSKRNEIALPHFEKAIQVYEEAIKVLPSAIMFSLYTRFLRETFFPMNVGKQGSEILDSSDCDSNLISYALAVHERRANNMDCVSEDLACLYVTLYLQTGKFEEARTLAEKVCSERPLGSVDIWVLRIWMEMRCKKKESTFLKRCTKKRGFNFMTKADTGSVFEILRKVLFNTTVSKAERLWFMALKIFSSQRDYLDKLVELSVACVSRDGGSDDGFSLASAIIELLFQTDGIQRARRTYKRFLALPHPGLVFYKKCIELETNHALTGDKDSLVEVRKLYESAVATYNQDVCLWRNYHSLEIKMGTSEATNSVNWRAKKQLKDKIVLLSSANY